MDRLPRLSSRLAAIGVIALGACGRSDVLSVEPCMPVDELLARTPSLTRDDFTIDSLGELHTAEREWTRLTVTDGAKPLITLSEVRAMVGMYRDQVSLVCTDLLYGGPLAQLPSTIGPLRDAFLAHGFVIERATPGDLLSPSTTELLRQHNFLREDYTARLGVDLDPNGRFFLYDLCVASRLRCRSPELRAFQQDQEHLLDDYAPRVPPSREGAPPAPPPEYAP